MVLLYLYLPKYSIFKEAEFNFTDKYTLKYDSHTRTLKCVQNKQPLPDDFFSIKRNGASRVVESVTALVGNNGSGKTSIAQFFYDQSMDESIEHIIVWSSSVDGHTQLYCRHLVIPAFFPDSRSFNAFLATLKTAQPSKARIAKACYKRSVDGSFHLNRTSKYYSLLSNQFLHLKPKPALHFTTTEIHDISEPRYHSDKFDFIYITNNYATAHTMSTANEFIDLSTSGLMRSDSEKYHNNGPEAHKHYSEVKLHDRMELQRMAALQTKLNNNYDELLSHLELPKPCGVEISVYLADAKQLKDYLLQIDDSPKWSQTVTHLHEQFESWLAQSASLDYADLLRFAFIGNWLRYHAKGFTTPKALRERFTAAILTAASDIHALPEADFAKASALLFDHLYNITRHFVFTDDKDTPIHYHDDLSFDNAQSLYELLKRQTMPTTGPAMYLRLSDSTNVKLFHAFIDLYFKSSTITLFANFDWFPRIAAGEYAQWNMFSRLNSILSTTSHKLKKDIILFFDEIEVTIHPELQRRLVHNVILFLESLFADHALHVFFASHSPILLSDIPKSNVSFLQRKDNHTTVSGSADGYGPITFGANIHDLYRHSFFLKDGLIGSFASNHIESAIDSLRAKDQLAQRRVRKLIDVIDEPLIRDHLLRMYSEVFEPSDDEENWLRNRLAQITNKSDGDLTK